MNKEEPKVLTRMRLSCCWGDNLNVTELNEVGDYINTLQQENKQLKEIIEEIKNIDIFKEFTFPLMKRWEEQQVLSSIDYQFKNTFIKK